MRTLSGCLDYQNKGNITMRKLMDETSQAEQKRTSTNLIQEEKYNLISRYLVLNDIRIVDSGRLVEL